MENDIIIYLASIMPALAAVASTIITIIKVIKSVNVIQKDNEESAKQIENKIADELKALNSAIDSVYNNAEIVKLKLLYRKACTEIAEANKINAELLAKLNERV